MKILIRFFVIVLGLLVVSRVVPGITIGGFYSAVVVALLWAVISITLKPILFLLTLPINILTLGLFSFVINALLFWFLASFVDGFSVSGFVPALLGSLLLSVCVWLSHKIS